MQSVSKFPNGSGGTLTRTLSEKETTHAIMDELEWPREDRKLSPEMRDQAVNEMIGIVTDVDGILQIK